MSKISECKNYKTKGSEMENKVTAFLEELNNLQFSKEIIQKYTYHLNKFKDFCYRNNITDFLSDSTFSNFFKSISNNSKYSINYFNKTLNKFKHFSLYGTFKLVNRANCSSIKSSEFNNCLRSFEKFLKQSEIRETTLKLQYRSVRQFLIFLEENNIQSFSQISVNCIFKYINSSKLAHATKYGRAQIIKKFLNFTYSKNITNFSGKQLFPKIKRNPNERILSFYSVQEVEKLIKTIDADTSIGKRDYAIILIAALLGLRASDIVNLKLKNIDWNNKLIKIKQQKTGINLIQPFPDEIMYALLDYIKNTRNKTNYSNIFISSVAPFRPLCTSALSSITTKYFKKSSVDISSRKHGIHSLRHSMANNMLHNNVSLQDISASLGHSYLSTTTMYTNIDAANLGKLCLEVNELCLKK